MELEALFDLNTNRRHDRHDVLQLLSQHVSDGLRAFNKVYIRSDDVHLPEEDSVNSV